MARNHETAQPGQTEPVDDRLSSWTKAIPIELAIHIIADDLPEDLSAKPAMIIPSPEVPVPLPEEERLRLIATRVPPEAIERFRKQLLEP